jgi:hypothetical protein
MFAVPWLGSLLVFSCGFGYNALKYPTGYLFQTGFPCTMPKWALVNGKQHLAL